MAVFRGKMLAAIRQAWAHGEVTLPEPLRPQQLLTLLNRLGHPTKMQWNVRIMERYRHGVGVVTSLARYLRGGPIKNARLVAWDGNRVTFTCVTTPSRIPTLTSKRVDIIISTLTYTKARAEVIDYSVPYYGATGRLLVPNNSNIQKLSDLSGKTLATTRGSIYDRWLHNCFKNTNVILTDTTSTSLLAVRDRRAGGFMFDDAFLVGVAANDPNTKLLGARFLAIPWGIGIRKGETDMRAWVNSRLKLMKKRDQFWLIMRHTIPRRFFPIFKSNVPRPKNTLKYPTGADPETVCP